jgi:putative ABC transport system permease protein
MSLQSLRTISSEAGLSLTALPLGIFCIISVLTTVDSLQNKIQSDINAFGTNTIYVDNGNTLMIMTTMVEICKIALCRWYQM